MLCKQAILILPYFDDEELLTDLEEITSPFQLVLAC